MTSCCGQTKVVYHEYEPTASDFSIVRWNISKDALPKYYVAETIDKKGRVIELKFYQNKSTIFERLCYLVPWIKYEYPNDTTIIQYNLDGYGHPESGLECEVPSKVIYHLSKDKTQILSSKSEYQIDKVLYLANGWTIKAINDALNALKTDQTTYQSVDYYSNSKSKLNGKFPISKNFDINEYYFNHAEKTEIEKALARK